MGNRIALGVGILGVLALAGCQTDTLPITQDPVTASLVTGIEPARVEDLQMVAVRSFVADPEDPEKSVEVADARCTLSAPEFKASVITPQAVQIPRLVGEPGNMTVSCTRGATKGVQVIEPQIRYKSGSVVGSGSAGAFAAGLLISVAVNSASRANAKKRDIWSYVSDEQVYIPVRLR